MYHFFGIKLGGMTVAVMIDRNGQCEQMGLNTDDSPCFSSKPFNAKRFHLEHVAKDWVNYLCESLNLTSVIISESKLLKPLRDKCKEKMLKTTNKVYGVADDGEEECVIERHAKRDWALKNDKSMEKNELNSKLGSMNCSLKFLWEQLMKIDTVKVLPKIERERIYIKSNKHYCSINETVGDG